MCSINYCMLSGVYLLQVTDDSWCVDVHACIITREYTNVFLFTDSRELLGRHTYILYIWAGIYAQWHLRHFGRLNDLKIRARRKKIETAFVIRSKTWQLCIVLFLIASNVRPWNSMIFLSYCLLYCAPARLI